MPSPKRTFQANANIWLTLPEKLAWTRMKSLIKNIPFLSDTMYKALFWLRENTLIQEGKGNLIQNRGARIEHCHINIQGNHNQLFFSPGCSIRNCQIEVIGDYHQLWIDSGVILTQSILWFEDHHCQIKIGLNSTMQRNGHIAVTEPFRKIEIGTDCMFSFDVDIRNGDSHSIIDIETGKRINWAKDIIIGNHVWLGAKTEILGGAEIGDNSIIGIGSLVNGKIPADCIAVGSPARVAKSGFTWQSTRILEGDPFSDRNEGSV